MLLFQNERPSAQRVAPRKGKVNFIVPVFILHKPKKARAAGRVCLGPLLKQAAPPGTARRVCLLFYSQQPGLHIGSPEQLRTAEAAFSQELQMLCYRDRKIRISIPFHMRPAFRSSPAVFQLEASPSFQIQLFSHLAVRCKIFKREEKPAAFERVKTVFYLAAPVAAAEIMVDLDCRRHVEFLMESKLLCRTQNELCAGKRGKPVFRRL